MSGEAHYFFPPARALALNRCLYALKSDDDFRARPPVVITRPSARTTFKPSTTSRIVP